MIIKRRARFSLAGPRGGSGHSGGGGQKQHSRNKHQDERTYHSLGDRELGSGGGVTLLFYWEDSCVVSPGAQTRSYAMVMSHRRA